MTSMKEENIELQVDWELRTVGIVVKNWVIYDEHNETVECLRLNPELLMKSFWAMKPPVVEKMELR
jgi:hypothetical protein